jgi:hypothetical protein
MGSRKVICTVCDREFASEGPHLQSFPDLSLYVCLLCTAKREVINVENRPG